MDKYMKKFLISSILIVLITFSVNADPSPHVNAHKLTDEYLLGFVQGLFVYSYELRPDAVSVKNSVVYVRADRIDGDLPPEQFIKKLKKSLFRFRGIKEIVLCESGHSTGLDCVKKETPVDGFLPAHSLFRPLIADPKWPRFSLAYQSYTKNPIYKQGFAPNAGASIPIYRAVGDGSEWELGIQGNISSIFNLDSSSHDLINADYYISLPLTFRTGPWTTMVRVYHQSSHLGDEFLLSALGRRTTRVNLSYEGLDALLSFNYPIDGMEFRLYGGGGYLIHKQPSNLKPLKLQAGAEYYAARTFWRGRIRPVTGLDVKIEQYAGWKPNVSFKTGFQFENSVLRGNKVQLMLEAYSGKWMNGQFFNIRVKYLGLGLHVFL